MTSMSKSSSGIDSKSWLWGGISGNTMGALHALPFFTFSQHLNYSVKDGYINTADIIATIAWGLGVYVAPLIVSLIARHKPFLWGFLPVALFFGWDIICVLITHRNGLAYLQQGAVRIVVTSLIAVLLTSGPVSLIRMLNSRQDKPASQEPIAGDIWPPPPDNR